MIDYQLDCLQYTELPLTEDDEAIVSQLIQHEIQEFEPKDYLSQFPPVPPERANTSKEQDDEGLDFERYELDIPAFEKSTKIEEKLEVWCDLVQRAKVQIQHQKIRILNLQLLDEYGQNAWLEYLKTLENHKQALDKAVQIRQTEVTSTNEDRQSRQFEWAGEIARFEIKWKKLIQDNIEIQNQLSKLQKIK